MKKAILQGSTIIILFFSTWFVLTLIDWASLFQVQKKTDQIEEKLGNQFWEFFKSTETECTDQFVINSIDTIVNRICSDNSIERDFLKIHIFLKDEVNAFALPNGHLVIFSGLILASENPEELSGVISHEIAHIQLNHVMKKLVKEIGLSVLISITTGNNSAEIIKETAKMLSSSAFDRGLEKEADLKAVDYLIKSNINPEQFANFLYKLSGSENELMRHISWVSTHPESKERARYIIEYSKDRAIDSVPIFSNQSWVDIKGKLTEAKEE